MMKIKRGRKEDRSEREEENKGRKKKREKKNIYIINGCCEKFEKNK